jgi:hypothetical protein
MTASIVASASRSAPSHASTMRARKELSKVPAVIRESENCKHGPVLALSKEIPRFPRLESRISTVSHFRRSVLRDGRPVRRRRRLHCRVALEHRNLSPREQLGGFLSHQNSLLRRGKKMGIRSLHIVHRTAQQLLKGGMHQVHPLRSKPLSRPLRGIFCHRAWSSRKGAC